MPGRQPWARFSPQVKSSQKVEKAEETKVQMSKSHRSGAEEPDSQFHRIANERITSLKFSQGRFLFAGLAACRASLRLRTRAGLYKLRPRVGRGVARGAGNRHRSHAVDRLGGLILGSKDGIDVTVTVRPPGRRHDPSSRAVLSGDRDLTLSRRFDSAYERNMGR
jgi:hypothetical protein